MVPPISSSENSDILLNHFQIKKRRHRVLLKYDHIVWERLQTKFSADDDCILSNGGHELEQLPFQVLYSNRTKIMHMNELIRVSKGNTKAAALHIAVPQPIADFNSDIVLNQQQEQPNTNAPPTEHYLALSYASRIINSAIDCNRWKVRNLMLYNADAYVVRQWHDLLNKILEKLSTTRVRRLLVFINPYGGRQRGLNIYERHCKPLFMLAGIDASCIITQRSNQIRDILLSHDLAIFDAVCCVGGDGTVAEVINGLIFRAISDKGMDPRHPLYVPKSALPIAIIPAGSTDTVAYSLHGTADASTAAIHLILGQRRGMDICSVRNTEGMVRFCASLLSYGYLGDIAVKSERNRWMGTKRYEFTGLKTFLVNNSYEAELRILQLIDDNNGDAKETSTISKISEVSNDIICCADCIRCNTAAENENKLAAKPVLLNKRILGCIGDDNELPSSSKVSPKLRGNNIDARTRVPYNKNHLAYGASQCAKCTSYDDLKTIDFKVCEKISESAGVEANEIKCSIINELNNPINNKDLCSQWKTINGKFFMISGANITCACSRSPNGLARYSHTGDGYLDLILVRKTSLLNNIRLLLNIMGRNGDIRNLPFVETYRTKRFCFRSTNANLSEENIISGSCQPNASSAVKFDHNDGKNVSSWNCDGEVISAQELTMVSHCQLIDVFMRGPHRYKAPLKNNKRSVFCCCCSCCKSDN
ncbi:ceramide kinase isoform X2 [Eurosta solidaginis]|uniref:ceramide kinase isoform X2 n=1 Tax=Eurosta solidaginis TaxID=178769 RepID=UPI003530CD3D